ncbi:MAG: hypothetical protein JJU05_01620 [Verrucomicrobia bacterium]|nr:hypothetical protein [Verrucomicrobiota bacterium]MCH8528993.1 hypothetical protein [Kiritimatiellia bacterium]
MNTLKTLTLLLIALPQVLMSEERVFIHEETGIILPRTLGAFTMGTAHVFDEKELGVVVPYNSDGASVSVYIYTGGIPEDPENASPRKKVIDELVRSLGELRALEEMGIYERVTFADSGRMRGNENLFPFMYMPLTFDQVKDAGTGESINRRRRVSMIGVGLCKGHFVKVRYSFRRDEHQEEQEKRKEDFLNRFLTVVHEVFLRVHVEEYLETYMKMPLSEEGREALGAIVTYAERSELILVRIHSGVTPWFAIEDYPYSRELLGAYIAGQVYQQLRTNTFESDEDAGMKQVLEIYKLLREIDEKAYCEPLEKLLDAARLD